MPKFGRLVTAMVTPFNADLSVDYARAADLARRLTESGTDTLVVAGTTGESPTLTGNEKIKLFETVVEAVGSKAQVLAGTGSNNTADTISLSKKAEITGVSGLLLVGPYYNKPPQEGYFQHFKAVAEATRLPIMLYNVPGRTGGNIEAATTLRLARECPGIVAIKEASGNLDQYAEIIAGAPEGFSVYTGNDNETLPALAIGCVGVVSVAAHVAGPQMKELMDAYLQGDAAQAAAWHRKLLPLFKGLFTTANPILVKAALAELGYPVGGLRPPLVEATTAQRGVLRQILADTGLL